MNQNLASPQQSKHLDPNYSYLDIKDQNNLTTESIYLYVIISLSLFVLFVLVLYFMKMFFCENDGNVALDPAVRNSLTDSLFSMESAKFLNYKGNKSGAKFFNVRRQGTDPIILGAKEMPKMKKCDTVFSEQVLKEIDKKSPSTLNVIPKADGKTVDNVGNKKSPADQSLNKNPVNVKQIDQIKLKKTGTATLKQKLDIADLKNKLYPANTTIKMNPK